MDYSKIVKKVNELLTENNEWKQRYAGYAQDILNKENIYKKGKTKFRPKSPLYCYTSVSKVTGNIEYDIRFCGQSVATAKIINDDIFISTNKDKDKSNKEYFDIGKPLVNEDWKGKNASEFRAKFTKELQKKEKGKSREHHVENILLAEFGKKKSVNKILCNIKPILLCDLFFQMPTPLTASKELIKPAKKGGGIDILTRVRHKKGSGGRRICVMELKDENKANESPQKVMNQAIAYATFIARLLRSESGNKWYNIFGFRSTVPEKLIIDVSIVMPFNKDRNENFETIELIPVAENTYLKLYSLYFHRNETGVQGFAGSLKDDLLNP